MTESGTYELTMILGAATLLRQNLAILAVVFAVAAMRPATSRRPDAVS